jgi:hypothetical protein
VKRISVTLIGLVILGGTVYALASHPPTAARDGATGFTQITEVYPELIVPHLTHHMLMLPSGDVIEWQTPTADKGAWVAIAIDVEPLVKKGLKLDTFPPHKGPAPANTWVVHPAMGTENTEHPGHAHGPLLLKLVPLPKR